MQERNLISAKMQYILSCIPFFVFFIAVFCGAYNFKIVKRRSYFYILGYWLLVSIPWLIFTGLSVLAISSFASEQSEMKIIISILYTFAFFVSMLIGAFYAVWLQNRLLKRIEREENEMYLI